MLICDQLHTILRNGKRFYWNKEEDNKERIIDEKDLPSNGIYIVFDKGEAGHNGDRIVRIGTHNGQGEFRSRISQHFINENKNRSIFRKNIGRAFLYLNHDEYLKVWNYDTTSRAGKEKYGPFIDKTKETLLETKISNYIRENLYFVALAVDTKEQRLGLEKKLIGTVSNCRDCKPSPNWLGNSSPILKINNSGLWLVQGLYSAGLNEDDLIIVENLLIK